MNSPPSARLGRQEPRLRRVPAYSSSLGGEAIDLAAAAGLVLDPWQEFVVRDVFGVDDFGSWSAMETCAIVARQQGKGGIIETIELAALFLLGERLILHSAHEYRTANEAFLRIKGLVEGNGDLSRHVRAIRTANGEQQVELMDGARLRFVARSKGSGRGFSAPRNILDEAYALTFAQYAALLPTVSAQPNPQINMFSTVPDPDTMPADPTEAVLPQVHKRALSANPGRLCYHDWSIRRDELPAGDPASDPVVFERYMELAYEANPALGIRISDEYVRGELLALGPAKFGVERLSVWPRSSDAGWLVVPKGLWDDAEWPDMPSPEQFALALAVEPDLSRSYITKVGPVGTDDNGRTLFGAVVIDSREGVSWAVDRLYERCASAMPLAVVMDRNSAAEQCWLECEARDANSSWDAVKLTDVMHPVSPRDECAAANLFYNGVAGVLSPDPDGPELPPLDPRTVRHLGQTELTGAVAAAVKKPSGNTWRWDETVPGTGALKGASEALFGYLKRQPAMETPWVWDGAN